MTEQETLGNTAANSAEESFPVAEIAEETAMDAAEEAIPENDSSEDKPEEETATESDAETKHPLLQWKKRMLERRRAQALDTYRGWTVQAERLKELYPQFSLEEECKNPGFLTLLRGGVEMQSAYEALHHREILAGALQYTAQRVSQQVAQGIRERAARPAENAIETQNGIVARMDIAATSRSQREDMERRAARGEKIVI